MIKQSIAKFVMKFLGRMMETVSKHDMAAVAYAREIPEKFICKICILGTSIEMGTEIKDGQCKKLKEREIPTECNAQIFFKSLDIAFPTLIGACSIMDAYNKHYVTVSGDVSDVVVFVGVVNYALSYMMPTSMLKNNMDIIPQRELSKIKMLWYCVTGK